MTPENIPPSPDQTGAPKTPEAVDPVRQRIRDMIDMDVFLGPPYGQRHGDDWSIGGVQPRWPRRSPPTQAGPLTEAQKELLRQMGFPIDEEIPTDAGVIINDDGTFTAPEADA